MLPSLPVAQVTIPTNTREETVRNTGYWKRVLFGSNPWDPNSVFSYALMYETLFGWDRLTDSLIPVIGTAYTWNSGGSSLSVYLNPAAKFNTGTTVTSIDVIESFKTALNQSRRNYDGMQERIDDIVVVNPTTIRFDLETDYEYSIQVLEFISSDVPIMSKSMLDTLKADLNAVGDYNYSDGELSEWQPNFWDTGSPAAYKVFSGPYEPYYLDATGEQEIVKLREDWWGFGEIYQDLPNAPTSSSDGMPTYVEKREYSTN